MLCNCIETSWGGSHASALCKTPQVTLLCCWVKNHCPVQLLLKSENVFQSLEDCGKIQILVQKIRGGLRFCISNKLFDDAMMLVPRPHADLQGPARDESSS